MKVKLLLTRIGTRQTCDCGCKRKFLTVREDQRFFSRRCAQRYYYAERRQALFWYMKAHNGARPAVRAQH